MTGLGQPQPDLGRIERHLLGRHGRREGREIRFLCPAHDDTHPSARWSQAKRSWYCDVCRQGGGWRDLCGRLGIEESSSAAPRREIAAAYGYRDAAGRLLYEVIRHRPKAFACRRPDGAGGWLWSLDGVERVLYRLPEVLGAVARDELVLFVEGEKDADALAALGFTATTHAGGAGRWRSEYAGPLRGARVVIIPDNDDAGRRHAAAVLEGLRGKAAEIRKLELPGLTEKGDSSDWLAARRAEGLGEDQVRCRLLDLALGAPVLPRGAAAPDGGPGGMPDDAGTGGDGWSAAGAGIDDSSAAAGALAAGRSPFAADRSGAEGGAAARSRARRAGGAAAVGASPARRLQRLSEITPQAVSFLWEPYLPIGKLTLLEGDPGQGKSWLTTAIAAAGSRGRGLPGTAAAAPFRTLFLTAEDGLADTLRPRFESLGGDCDAALTFDQPLSLVIEDDLAALAEALAENQPRLVVIDPLVAFLGHSTDLYRANEVRSLLAPLIRLAERHGCALLAVRHLNKAKLGRAIYAGQGSIDFTAAARSVLLAGSSADDGAAHALVHIKSNLAAQGPTLAYRLAPAFAWEGHSRLTADDLLAAAAPADEASAEEEACNFLRTTLARGETLPARLVITLARDAGISQRTLKRAKRTQGVRTVRRGFGAGSSWFWSLPEGAEEGQKGAEEGHTETWPPSANAGPLRDAGGAAGASSTHTEDATGSPACEVFDTQNARDPKARREAAVPAKGEARGVAPDLTEPRDSASPSDRKIDKDCLL
jgi:hypothetical protein